MKNKNPYLAPQFRYSFAPVIAGHFGLEQKDIFAHSSKHTIVEARQLLIWLMYHQSLRETGKPHWIDIAREFQTRPGKHMHHATIIYHVRTVSGRLEVDKHFRQQVYEIQRKIFGKVIFEN